MVDVDLVRVESEVGMRGRASPVRVLVAMQVGMSAAVTVRVHVH